MQQNLVNFLVLHFSRFNKEAVGLLVLDSNDGSPLQVWASPDWKLRVDAADQSYLSGLMDEWRNTAPRDIPALLDELSRQSHGPLRLCDRGQASPKECRALIDGLLQRTDSSESSR